jgi:uncharacterized protein (DUF433 family)
VTPGQKKRLKQVVWVEPERMSGAPCFTGTRVPVQALVDYLVTGSSIDEFLIDYPSVTREQAVTFAEAGKEWPLEFVPVK